MQLTINSAEPLSDVLRVVGSLYGVDLVVNPPTASPTDQTSPARSQRQRSRGNNTSARRRESTPVRVDARTVREWAGANGYEVNARGSLSAAVREAFAAAHPS